MKKIKLWVAIVLALTLLLSACAPTGNQGEENKAESEATEISEQSSDDGGSEQCTTTLEVQKIYIPDYELLTPEGGSAKLADYTEEKTILCFWATWCGYCKEEMPLLNEINKRDDVKVVMISSGEDLDTIKAFVDDHDYDMDFLIDETGEVISELGISGFPTSVFVKKDLEFVTIGVGAMDEAGFDDGLQMIEDAIANPAPEQESTTSDTPSATRKMPTGG